MNPHLPSFWHVSPAQITDPPLHRGAVTIRPATLEDVCCLADVLTYSFHDYRGVWGWVIPLLRLGVYEDLCHRLKQPKEQQTCFVACVQVGGVVEVVGTVELSVRYVKSVAIAPMKAPYIANLAVNPRYRRLGIARKLLARCESQVKYWHYSSVALHVLENNEAAKQLYLGCGYQVQYAERPLNALLLRRPRRLFLQKDLSP